MRLAGCFWIHTFVPPPTVAVVLIALSRLDPTWAWSASFSAYPIPIPIPNRILVPSPSALQLLASSLVVALALVSYHHQHVDMSMTACGRMYVCADVLFVTVCVWEWGLGVRCSTLTKLNSVYHSCLWSCFCGDISHLTLIHSASEFSVLGSLWSWSTPPSASTPPFEFQNILRQQCENKLTPPSSVPSIVFDSGNCVAIGHTPNIPFMMLAMFIALSP